MRVRCGAIRYFPDPLGIFTAEQIDKLELGGESPQTIRARCGAIRYCPDPLGIVTAEQIDKLELAWILNEQKIVRHCEPVRTHLRAKSRPSGGCAPKRACGRSGVAIPQHFREP